MNNYRELKVWQVSIELAVELYSILKSFPKSEQFGLTSQIKRSAISISSNIAEGAGRNSKKEFNQFLGVASGPTSELSTQLEIAQRIGVLQISDYNAIEEKIAYVQKMTYKLQKSIKDSK